MLFSAIPINMKSRGRRRKVLTSMLAAATFAGGGRLPAAGLEAVLLSGNGAPGIPGFANMNGVYRMAVNNRGDWVARASRTNGDVVLKNREILVDNNTPEVTFNSIYSMSINNHGDAVSIVYRKDAKVGEFSNGNQVYLNERVLATPGQVMAAPTLPPGTVYRSIYDAVINDLNQVHIVAIAVSPPNDSYQIMLRLDLDAAGNVLKETVVYRDGHLSTTPPGSIYNPSRQSWEWEVNNRGQVIHYATVFLTSGGSDQTLFRDFQKLFEEDTASPIAGRTAKYVLASHLNDQGSWAAVVGFADAHIRAQMILRDGVKIVELGDPLPPGRTLSGLLEPLFLDHDGDVFWLGNWKKPDTSTGTGLFLNDTLLVESDVTLFQGMPLRINLGGTGGSFGASDDGGFVIFAAYWNGLSGLFRIKVQDPVALTIAPTAGGNGPFRLSCLPRADVSGVQLQESPDLWNWQPPTGLHGLPIPRPAAGWVTTPLTWEIQPGAAPRFFRVAGTRN
jgi:hypothetical protein